MSRATASKTRSYDKTKPPASHTPVIAHEIVPGKFYDNDWNVMLDRDTSDEFVRDIMDELMESTMKAVYEKYIEHQLLPFTITQAREAMVEIIEWHFLAKDDGEYSIETDQGWAEDEEPEPAVTDCWAQGSVPRNLITAPSPSLEDVLEETQKEEEHATAEVPATEENSEPIELADYVSDTEEIPQEPTGKEATKEDEGKGDVSTSVQCKGNVSTSVKYSYTEKSSKTKFHPYRGKLKSPGLSKMTESLIKTEMKKIYNDFVESMPNSDKSSILLNMPASCTSILKVQAGRPPGNKDVVYDDMGNVLAVMRLDPEKLPTHKVSVKYHVVDPAVEAAQARLDAMRRGKSIGSKRKIKTSSMKIESLESVSTGQLAITKTRQNQHSATVAPLPPPLIEEMEVSHGVIVREGGRVKKGPGRYYREFDILKESQKEIKPISMHINYPVITVGDLLDRDTPILRPLGESSPLPPILPHPPPQQPQQV